MPQLCYLNTEDRLAGPRFTFSDPTAGIPHTKNTCYLDNEDRLAGPRLTFSL